MRTTFSTDDLQGIIDDLGTSDKVRVPLTDDNSSDRGDRTHIDFYLSYDKGHQEYHPHVRRGFYLSVQPVKVEPRVVQSYPRDGVRGFVSPEPVTRTSKAARKTAHDTLTVDTLARYLEQVG